VLLEACHRLVVLGLIFQRPPKALPPVAEAGPAQTVRRHRLWQVDRGGLFRDPAALARAFVPAACRSTRLYFHFGRASSPWRNRWLIAPFYWDVQCLAAPKRLLMARRRRAPGTIVFSSSATLYGLPETVAHPGNAPLRPSIPMATGKGRRRAELLADVGGQRRRLRNRPCLRYFNPRGLPTPVAASAKTPAAIPNNLFPIPHPGGEGRPHLESFGHGLANRDGTGGATLHPRLMDWLRVTARSSTSCLAEAPQHLIPQPRQLEPGPFVLELVQRLERALRVTRSPTDSWRGARRAMWAIHGGGIPPWPAKRLGLVAKPQSRTR